MSKQATDNSNFEDKASFRLQCLPDCSPVRVLDAFAGYGKVWEQVQFYRKDKQKFDVLSIERRRIERTPYLMGDNVKFLKTLDLASFDVIDLDDYGFPYEQLSVLFERQYKGVVFITFGATGGGNIHHGLLHELGFSDSMLSKIQTLFTRNPFARFCQYLSRHGIDAVDYISQGKIYYMKIDMVGA